MFRDVVDAGMSLLNEDFFDDVDIFADGYIMVKMRTDQIKKAQRIIAVPKDTDLGDAARIIAEFAIGTRSGVPCKASLEHVDNDAYFVKVREVEYA